MKRRQPPLTARSIYRIGQPIPFPTSIEELTDQLIWALDMLHINEHQFGSELNGSEYLAEDRPISPWCRMKLALQDRRFKCLDPWHLLYQSSGACPTCDHDWVALARD